MDCWIPECISYDGTSDWAEYENNLYKIFVRDFINSRPTFLGEPVHIRIDPRFDGKEEGFWHLTCRDYKKGGFGPESRDPELSRCERIEWPRAFIENYRKCKSHAIEDCNGVLVWSMAHKSRTSKKFNRFMLMSEEDRYIVILEHRPKPGYYFLISAYYLDNDYSLKSNLRNWEKHKISI